MGNSRSGSPRDGLGFHINFPIEVTQLGLSKKALNAYFNRFKNGNVTIELIDATNREVLTMMNFGYNDLKIPSDDGFMYKMIDAENLHKGFEGLLRIRPSETWKSVDKVNLTCNIDWNHVFGEDGPIIWRSSYIGNHHNLCTDLASLIKIFGDGNSTDHIVALHSVEKREIHCHANFFPSNQFTANFFCKTVI